MAIPKTKQITVTTVQDVLISNRGNQFGTAEELNINRGTLRDMIADERPNIVIINDDGSYTVLK